MELRHSEKTLDITAYIVIAMSIVLFAVLLFLPKIKSNKSKTPKVMNSDVYETQQNSEKAANDVEYPEEEIENERDITIEDISDSNITEIGTIANKELEKDINYYKFMSDGSASVAGIYVLTNDEKDKNIVYALINRSIIFYDLPLSYYDFLKFKNVEKKNGKIDFENEHYEHTNSFGKDGTFFASNENGERELAGYETVESFEEQIIEPLREKYSMDKKCIENVGISMIDEENGEEPYWEKNHLDRFTCMKCDNDYTVRDILYLNKDKTEYEDTQGTARLLNYCIWDNNEELTNENGYEWKCFDYIMSPLKGPGGHSNLIIDYYTGETYPLFYNDKEFTVTWNGNKYEKCVGKRIDEKTTDDGSTVSTYCFRLPVGYDGLVFAIGYYPLYKEYFDKELLWYSKLKSIAEIDNKELLYFRLDKTDILKSGTTVISDDGLSGDYDYESESNAFVRITKKDTLWEYAVMDKETEEIFDVRQYVESNDNTWDCITPNKEEYYIEKQDENTLMSVEDYDVMTLNRR